MRLDYYKLLGIYKEKYYFYHKRKIGNFQKPPKDISSILPMKHVLNHDIVAIGTEECCRSIGASIIANSK